MLLGRHREVAQLAALLEEAAEGRSRALLLTGEAGIGKSALLRETLDEAQRRGLLVLSTRGYEAESDIPFAGLLELLTPLLPLRDRIPEVQARALGSALALEPPTPFDRFAVPAAMLSLLGAAAEAQPVLVAIDDLHWLDDATREATAFVARRLSAEGVVLLGALRPSPEVVATFEGVDVVAVAGLAEADAAELLQRSAARDIAGEVEARLLGTARGNPLALLEIPRILSAGQLAGREPLTGPLDAGDQIAGAFTAQVAGLPAATRKALLLAASSQSGLHDEVVRALAERGLPADALDPALREGLVTIGRRVEFAHPLLRSAIYHSAGVQDRRAAHAALATVAETPARRTWHLAASTGGPDEEVAAAVEAAARDARARGGIAEAARAFERAADLSPTDGARARRLLEAASDFAQSGAPDHAIAIVGQAEKLARGGATTEVVRVRGRVEMRRGAPLAAHDVLVAEADRIEAGDPVPAASLLVEAAVAHMMTGDMEALVATGDRARTLLGDGQPLLGLLAGVLVGEAHAALGHEEEADALLDPAVPVLTGDDVLSMPAEIVGMAGQCAIWYERWDRAEAVLDHLVVRARDASAINHLIYPLGAHAILDFRRGRWTAALADAAEAVELARDTGQRPLLAFAAAALGHVEAAMGRRDDARGHARECVAIGELLGGSAITVYGLNALGLDALGHGEPEAAVEYYDRATRMMNSIRMQRGVVQLGADRVEALVRLGRAEEAHTAFEQFADAPGGGRWAQAALARCRALLSGGDHERHFETALHHHEHDGQPFERARTQLAYGERLRRDRRRADAREQLVEALETFERLGAAPWAQRARTELRATGGAAAGEPPTAEAEAVAAAGLDELTAHELRIARLVAYGLTNREVAAKLFLSPKTIEYHLSQIYRKLDLRSRTQLASLMASELGGEAKAA